MHLLTDYLFYNKYIDRMTKDMYNDYDITNKKLIDKYKVELPDEIKDSVFFKEGNLQILSYDLLYKMIDAISNMDIDKIAKDVIESPEKWTKFRELKRI